MPLKQVTASLNLPTAHNLLNAWITIFTGTQHVTWTWTFKSAIRVFADSTRLKLAGTNYFFKTLVDVKTFQAQRRVNTPNKTNLSSTVVWTVSIFTLRVFGAIMQLVRRTLVNIETFVANRIVSLFAGTDEWSVSVNAIGIVRTFV